PRHVIFTYTTLFRSVSAGLRCRLRVRGAGRRPAVAQQERQGAAEPARGWAGAGAAGGQQSGQRSGGGHLQRGTPAGVPAEGPAAAVQGQGQQDTVDPLGAGEEPGGDRRRAGNTARGREPGADRGQAHPDPQTLGSGALPGRTWTAWQQAAAGLPEGRGGAGGRLGLRWRGLSSLRRSAGALDRKSTRLNSSHVKISYAVFCLKKKTKK